MPSVEKLLVFLASPSDVPTERRYVEEVVAELNRTVANEKGLVLQVIRWENDAFPGYGMDAQAVINAQIAAMEKYALFIGIIWNRLGTPTPRAESGTVEEFERATQARAQSGQPEIWFYFRQAAARLDTPDQLDQRKKVLALKEQVQVKGLPWTYKNPSEFRDKLRNQMIFWLIAYSRRETSLHANRDQLSNPLSLDLVDKLIGQCIQLIEQREKTDWKLYSDFLASALEDFEKVHKNYIETFIAYRKILQSNQEPLNIHHPILNLITEHSLLSADIRSKVIALDSFEDDPLFGRFIRRMTAYLVIRENAQQYLLQPPIRMNAIRSKFDIGLKQIFKQPISEDEKKVKALELADYILSEIQDSYQIVMDEHVRLKARLLGLKPPKKPLSRADAEAFHSETITLELRKRLIKNKVG